MGRAERGIGPASSPAEDGGGRSQGSLRPKRCNLFNRTKYQRTPTRLTGPPRFIGLPARTPTPGAPTPGVATTAAATGAPGATTTAASGRTTHPLGTPTVLQ